MKVITRIGKPVKSDPPVNPADRWAVANRNWLENWWLDSAYSTWANFPMSAKQCDNGNTTSRGRNIPVSNGLMDFAHKLNNADGIKFIESVDRLICNRPYIDRYGKIRSAGDIEPNPDPQMMAEPIIYPPNPYQIIDETRTHYRVDAYYYGMDFSTLNPLVDNWVNKPWKIIKCSAEARNGTIQNVMRGIDAYWLTLCAKTGAWVPKDLLTLAPDPAKYVIGGKRGVGYRLIGANWIIGLEDGSQVTVRRVTKADGVNEYYGWHLNARSVVPPAWFK